MAGSATKQARPSLPCTTDESANRHCEPLAGALDETRMFDWLGGYLS